MNKPIEASIKCPFYSAENKDYICCEGIIAGTCMTTRFATKQTKKEHLKNNCFLVDGGNCPMAKNLFAKYGQLDLIRDKK